jgi:hypothetical protein
MATSPLQAVVDTILLSIHDIQTLYDNLLRLQYPWTGRFWVVIFSIICGLVLEDMLISMIIYNYDETSEFENEWMRQVN